MWHFTKCWILLKSGRNLVSWHKSCCLLILRGRRFAVPFRHGSKAQKFTVPVTQVRLYCKWELLSTKTFENTVPEVLTVVINYENSCFQTRLFLPKLHEHLTVHWDSEMEKKGRSCTPQCEQWGKENWKIHRARKLLISSKWVKFHETDSEFC